MPAKKTATIIVPRDAYEILDRKFDDFDEAAEAASDLVSEDGMTVYILELKAVVSRTAPPVKIRKV